MGVNEMAESRFFRLGGLSHAVRLHRNKTLLFFV